MNLQKIKSLNGKDEYVLLPVAVYEVLKDKIDHQMAAANKSVTKSKASTDDYVPFLLEDYVDNPVALARMKANLTQKELADRMGVSQAYISKIERQGNVTPALLGRVTEAVRRKVR